MTVDHTPNPGSLDAIKLGCLCPVADNNHGERPPYPRGDAWFVSMKCPVHATLNGDAPQGE